MIIPITLADRDNQIFDNSTVLISNNNQPHHHENGGVSISHQAELK